jgi:hypothetical protein
VAGGSGRTIAGGDGASGAEEGGVDGAGVREPEDGGCCGVEGVGAVSSSDRVGDGDFNRPGMWLVCGETLR